MFLGDTESTVASPWEIKPLFPWPLLKAWSNFGDWTSECGLYKSFYVNANITTIFTTGFPLVNEDHLWIVLALVP